MKKKKVLFLTFAVLAVGALLLGSFFYINMPAEVLISVHEEGIEIGEPSRLDVVVKNRIGKQMEVNSSKLDIYSDAGDSMEVDGLKIRFSEIGVFSVEATYGDVVSNSIVVDVFRNPIGEVVDRTAMSTSNINPKIYFQLKHNFEFTDYNFGVDYEEDPTTWMAEYTDAYEKIYNGDAAEKQEAIDKLGNDILIKFIAIDEAGEETVVSAKTKAWNGYLNVSDGLDGSPEKLEGTNYERTLSAGEGNTYYSTAINMDAGIYFNSGYKLETILTIIEDGKVYERCYVTELSR